MATMTRWACQTLTAVSPQLTTLKRSSSTTITSLTPVISWTPTKISLYSLSHKKKPSYSGGKTITAKLKDSKSFNYVDDGENIQIVKDDNNKYHIHYGVDKEGKPTSKASGFESLEEAEKTLKKHRPNYTEKQNSTDNTTKETYNMEKIEVEQGFLASLIAMAQKPFLNAKEEEKSKEDKDEDEMEYEGEKYSKKELVNCFKAKKNEAEKEKEEEEEEKEEEKINSLDEQRSEERRVGKEC